MSHIRLIPLGLALLSAACTGSRPAAETAPSSAGSGATAGAAANPAQRTLVSTRRVAASRLATPAEAAAWRPQVPTPPTDGTCMQRDMPQPGVVTHIMTTKNPDSSSNTTTVVVDSTGRVLRYTESRGVPQVVLQATGLSPAQRDSAVRAQLGVGPRTLISLDYVTGEANASNLASTDEESAGIRGSSALFDTLPNLGVPRDRAARVRARCANR